MMCSFDELRAWIAENRPDLHAKLQPLSIDQARIALNQETGLSVSIHHGMDAGSVRFLDALKAEARLAEFTTTTERTS